MARCPGTSCEGFDGGGAVWFKIQQLGLKPGATGIGGGNWMQDQILSTQIFNSSDPHPVVSWSPSGLETVIPKTLKPGAYLIRHEIFNYGVLPKQPQSFPNCAQLMVQGDGTKSPSQEYLVSFPGAYKLDGKCNSNIIFNTRLTLPLFLRSGMGHSRCSIISTKHNCKTPSTQRP
jgi:hypothetical protein